MDSYILRGPSFPPSSQETIDTVEPLSADFLKYQLSRTPAPKRFSRNADRAPRAQFHSGIFFDEGYLNLTKADFRPVLQLISHDVAAETHGQSPKLVKRWPRPRHVTTAWSATTDGSVGSTAKDFSPGVDNLQVSLLLDKPSNGVPVDVSDDFILIGASREAAESKKFEWGKDAPELEISAPNAQKDGAPLNKTRVAIAHSSESPAKKVVLKRPKKRRQPPSAPPVCQQGAALAEVQVNRQFSILDGERPNEAKKQKRPRIARNLPVDELELAEERLVVSHDVTPMSSSDEADTDPLEESPSGILQRLRESKEVNVKHRARPIKEKQAPIRSSRKRLLTLSEFKVIKPLPTTIGMNEKKIWQQPAIGDGFEGSERLPTGRHSCPTKPRRRLRQQASRPTLYYRALEIAESKPFEVDPNTNQGTPGYFRPLSLDCATPHRESRYAAASIEPLLDELLMDVESSPASPRGSENVINTTEAVDIRHGNQQHQQDMETLKAPSQPNCAQSLLHNNQLKPVEVDEGPAAVLAEKEEEGEEEQDEEENAQSKPAVRDHVRTEALLSILEHIKAGTTPQADEGVQQGPVQTHQQMAPPLEHLFTSGKKKAPPINKIKRQVTFSDEVRIQRVVELESEEEYESDSEEQSQEYDSESDKSQSTDSEEEKSQQEDDDSNGTDDDAHDQVDDEKADGYPTTKLDERRGSPELVSSGYYVRSSSPVQCNFCFHADRTQSIASIAEDDINFGGDMILDMDEERERMSVSSSNTSQSKKYVDEIVDSDDEMLIPTSRATSAEKMLLQCSTDVLKTDHGEEEPSQNLLAMHPSLSHTEHGATHKLIIQGWEDKPNGTVQASFAACRLPKDLQRNLASSGVVMEPQASVAVFKSRGAAARCVSPPSTRKIKRAKTGLTLKQRSDQSLRVVSVRDVPSYFTQASEALSSPFKNVRVIMRYAKVLSATRYKKESDDEEGFIISNESFRDQLYGTKRHLSWSDSVKYNEQII